MIGGEMPMEIRVLAKHGKGAREIAQDLDVCRDNQDEK